MPAIWFNPYCWSSFTFTTPNQPVKEMDFLLVLRLVSNDSETFQLLRLAQQFFKFIKMLLVT